MTIHLAHILMEVVCMPCGNVKMSMNGRLESATEHMMGQDDLIALGRNRL